MMVFLTDFVDRASAAPMLDALTVLSRRHSCLFVAVEDPVIEEALTFLPATASEVFEKTVAYEMQQDRRSVLGQLTERGISVLNCQPNEICARLLNRYLQLRHSSAS